jgi:predicted MFS family arabinose efflux permease
MAAQTFGREHLATIYGSIAVGIGLGAGLGSWLHGVLYDVYGSYGPVLLSGATSLVLGLLPFLVIRDLKRH